MTVISCKLRSKKGVSTVNPSLVCCLAHPPPKIQSEALRNCPINLLSHFICIIVNKYVSQCLCVFLPCFSKLETQVCTDAGTYARKKSDIELGLCPPKNIWNCPILCIFPHLLFSQTFQGVGVGEVEYDPDVL